MTATFEQIAQAFSQWENDYRENPAAFMAEQTRLQTEASDFGSLCAKTLESYLAKQTS